LLDLFSGAGGGAAGYYEAGFDVVGVDIVRQKHYPYIHVVHEALDYLERHGAEFDAIHASPPCQAFSSYRRRGQGVGDKAVNLIPGTREILKQLGKPYVIENVRGAPLQSAVQLCGSSFGLDIRRHRLFETNWTLPELDCDHSWQTPRFPPAANRTNLRSTIEVGVRRIPLAVQREAMQIPWMSLHELSQAIPPAYTNYIGKFLIDEL